MIKLHVQAEGEEKILAFEDEPITFGRLATCQVVLQDKKSSREHAKIEKIGSEYRLSDLESGNGTRVNENKIVVHTLRRGDQIRIGDTVIQVSDLDAPASAPLPPPLPASAEADDESPPVPLEKKLELKKKIDGARAELEGARAKSESNTPFLWIGLAAAVLVVFAVIIIASGRSDPQAAIQKEQAAKEKKHKEDARVDEAKEALQKDRLDAFNGNLDVEATKRHAARYGKLLHPEDGVDPFTKLVLEAEKKRPAAKPSPDFEAQLAAARRDVETALAARRYADAIRIVDKMLATANYPQAEAALVLFSAAKDRIYNDYQLVLMEATVLENKEDFEGAKRVYLAAAPRFRETEYSAVLASKPGDLDLLARAKAADVLVKKEPKKEEIAKTDPPKDEPSKEEPKKEPAPKTDVAILATKLIEAVNAGSFTSPIKFSDSATGIPISADVAGLTLKDDSKVAWDEIEPKLLFRLYGQCTLVGDDLLALAEWGHGKELEADANKTLSLYLVRNKDQKAKVDEIVARWKGTSVPDGGFVYNSKAGVWEDKTEADNRAACEAAQGLGKELASVSDPKKMDTLVGKLLELHNNTSLKGETRDRVKSIALESLKANKKKRLDAIAGKAKSAAGFDKLRAMKLELNQRRDAAIKVIYDPKVYLPESYPGWRIDDEKGNGQEEVNRLVAAVRQLWEQGGAFLASLDPSIKRDIDGVQEIDARYLREFGEEPTEDDLKGFEEIMNNLNSKIDLKSFALTAEERKIYDWNRWVDRYTEALNAPAVATEEKEHFKVLNDYREMMGRKRLFLDPRLCRATKKHSSVCNAAQRIWHEGSDGSPQSRAQAEGFTAGVGENIAIGYGSPAEIWTRGWYRASDHHRNGLSDAWNCGGYGYVGSVGTQNFSSISPPKSK